MTKPNTMSTITVCKKTDSREPNPVMPGLYASLALAQTPRLLAAIDRQPHSRSFGSFDRQHWGWKFQDFPANMLQIAMYPLALLWRHPFQDNPYHQNPQLLTWVHAAISETCRRQHRNGAFDSVGPYTRDHGVTLAMAYGLAETAQLLGRNLPAPLRGQVIDAIARACRFARYSTEDYAFISNHHALFALAYLEAGKLLDDLTLQQQADRVIEQIIHHQSSEGWYHEYTGPDPGYESLGIHYLAACWRHTRSKSLLDSLRCSIEFYAHFVHPDASVGGAYGSRHTSLYFPAGFEILAQHIPMAGTVARFMRQRLDRHNVLTPAVVDAQNLAPLLYSYLEADLAYSDVLSSDTTTLPCQSLVGTLNFTDSGLTVAGSDRYYAVINTEKGGVCRVFDRRTEKIAYEDAGYVLTVGTRRWTSQNTADGRCQDTEAKDEVACTATLAEARQELPTPFRFVILRLLNLTLFRSLTLGAWLRRIIIGRLILAKKPAPVRLTRNVVFGSDSIAFSDQLQLDQPAHVDQVALPRTFTGIHMGSAKYFHLSELEPTPHVRADDMTVELNHRGCASCSFVIRWDHEAGDIPAIEISDSDQVETGEKP